MEWTTTPGPDGMRKNAFLGWIPKERSLPNCSMQSCAVGESQMQPNNPYIKDWYRSEAKNQNLSRQRPITIGSIILNIFQYHNSVSQSMSRAHHAKRVDWIPEMFRELGGSGQNYETEQASIKPHSLVFIESHTRDVFERRGAGKHMCEVIHDSRKGCYTSATIQTESGKIQLCKWVKQGDLCICVYVP